MSSEPFVQIGTGYRALDAAPTDLESGRKYFGNRLCPFAHRAWWAAHEKEIVQDLDLIHIELGPNKPAWFQAQVNSLGTVPIFYDEGRPVYESLILAEYFDEKNPNKGTALMPHDPVAKATVRFLNSRFGDRVIKPLYGLLMEPDISKQPELVTAARAALVSFNEDLDRFSPKTDPNSPWFVPSVGFSMVEVGVIPFLDRFSATLSYYRDFELLPQDGKHERLRSAFEASRARSAFKATSQTPDFYIKAYESYAKKRNSA